MSCYIDPYVCCYQRVQMHQSRVSGPWDLSKQSHCCADEQASCSSLCFSVAPSPLLTIALEGAGTLCTRRFPVQFRCVTVGIFCLSSPQFHCLSSLWHFVCLVGGFRYNSLATLALAAFGRVRALRARCGPFGPAIALKRGGRGWSSPPC